MLSVLRRAVLSCPVHWDVASQRGPPAACRVCCYCKQSTSKLSHSVNAACVDMAIY